MKRIYVFTCPANTDHEAIRIRLSVEGGERLGPGIAERIRKDFRNAHDGDACQPRIVER
jgi:hypothetical protein